jgi:hypothetical protein
MRAAICSFLLQLLVESNTDWKGFRDVVQKIQQPYKAPEWHSLEGTLNKLALQLSEVLSPYFWKQKEPHLEIRSNFHFMLFIHSIILRGTPAFIKQHN